MTNNNKDRFEKISNNYGELFSEVWAEQGRDHSQLEKSLFKNVSELAPDFKELPILDVGIGDGVSSKSFVEVGCKKLTGIDLNQEMLDASRKKLSDSVRLIKMDATDMSLFTEGEFKIIITAATIHNIPKSERVKFWKEILRLKPSIFVCSDKIKDLDINKHKNYYEEEVSAIKKVYGEKHGLLEAEKEWLEHYECDDREALEVDEIIKNLGGLYDVSVVSEMGMYKTVVAKIK